MKRQIFISFFCFVILSAISFIIPHNANAQYRNAQFIFQSVPNPMIANTNYSVSITMKNTGTITWDNTNYRLGSRNPTDNNTWGTTRIIPPSGINVTTGNNYTFNTTVRAPGTPGNYNFQWRMLLEGVEWFGDLTTNLVISVNAAPTPTPTPTLIPPTPTPTITPYPTIQITGVFKEDAGNVSSCTSSSFAPNASSLTIAITPASPAGVTPICPTSRPGDTSYSCNIRFDNQNTPGVIPNQDLTLYTNYPASNGYSSVTWRNPNSCSGSVDISSINVNASNPTNPYAKNIYFKYNTANNWLKLSNTSFNIRSNIGNSPIPNTVNTYDSDDTTDSYLIVRNGGTVTNYGNIAIGSNGNYSNNNWSINSYGPNIAIKPADLVEYSKSRKEYNAISTLTDIKRNTINVMTCSPSPCNINMDNGNVNNDPFILIVNGNVTINQNNKFNAPDRFIVIMAAPVSGEADSGKITFSANTREANGIFIADRIDVGTTTDQGLKIIGNLIALNQTDFTNTRNVSDKTKPSLFIVFDAKQYVNLLPILSTSKYDWNQLQ